MAFLIAASATFGFAQEHQVHQPKLTPQNSGTTQLLIAVSPVNYGTADVRAENAGTGELVPVPVVIWMFVAPLPVF